MLKKSDKQIIRVAVVATVFGLLAALVGAFAGISFFAPGGLFIKNVDIDRQNQEFLKTSLGIKAYGRLEVFEFLDKALPAVAGIYKKKPDSARFIDNLYLDKDRLGYGFVITSDGWVATNKTATGGWASRALAVVIRNQVYEVTDKVYDSWTDVVFLKVKAQELDVASFGNSADLQLGDVVFSGGTNNNFWFSYINALNFYLPASLKSDAILSSEEFSKVMRLQDEIPDSLDGGMLANKNGEVVGMIFKGKDYDYILPINYFKEAVSGVLKNQKITRPYFGVSYVDLEFALAKELPHKTGAYIYGGGFISSVKSGSPAYKAGLKIGDIILTINNEPINKYKNLAEIISEYSPGDELKLNILRQDEEKEIILKLGSK